MAPATPERTWESSGPHPGPGASGSPSADVPCGSHWPAAPSEAGAHVKRTDVRLGPAPAARASQRLVVSSSLGPLWAADCGWLEGQIAPVKAFGCQVQHWRWVQHQGVVRACGQTAAA